MPYKILVVNGPMYASALTGLGDFEFDIKKFFSAPEEFKLVLFTGGEDISPHLYGHTSPKRLCGCSPSRDAEEIYIFKTALKLGIPMTGICRGSQLLNVLSGGVMMHHISNHSIGGYHRIKTLNGEFQVTSTHHQMCVPSKNGYVLAESSPKLSNIYVGDKDRPMIYKGPEVEAIYYPDNKIFAVQYHPEYMPKDSAGHLWYKKGVSDLLSLTEKEFLNKYYLKPGIAFLANT